MFKRIGWNFRTLIWVSISTKDLSRIFDIYDLRSCEIRDLPIISHWEKFQLPLNAIQLTQYVQKHNITSSCWWFHRKVSPVNSGRCSLGHFGSPEFTSGFSSITWDWIDTGSEPPPLRLSRQYGSNNIQHDLFGSWPWPGQIFALTFWGQLIYRSTRLDELRTIVYEALFISLSCLEQKLLQKTISIRIDHFDLRWPLEAKPLTWAQIWRHRGERAWKELSNAVFRDSNPSSSRATAGFVEECRNCKNIDFFYFDDLWWPRFWPDRKNDRYAPDLIFDELSFAVCIFKIGLVVFGDNRRGSSIASHSGACYRHTYVANPLMDIKSAISRGIVNILSHSLHAKPTGPMLQFQGQGGHCALMSSVLPPLF